MGPANTDVWESAVTTATYTIEITLPARGAGPHLTAREVHHALDEISDVLAGIRVERTGIETGKREAMIEREAAHEATLAETWQSIEVADDFRMDR